MKRESVYAIVSWSESQRLMEIEDWEEHRFLITDGAGIKQYGCCAYAAAQKYEIGEDLVQNALSLDYFL